MSNPSANPILRRLSAAGSTDEDISMGAVTGSPEHVGDELIKLLAKIYIKETGYLRLDLSFATYKRCYLRSGMLLLQLEWKHKKLLLNTTMRGMVNQ